MIWEEQVTSLEQTTQEILKTQEGMVASEMGEAMGNPQQDIEVVGDYQESPIQARDSPEIQVA
jgi:hypothetical protein